jgi:hypothetical protein
MFKFLSILLLLLLIFNNECSSSMIDFTIIYSEDIFTYDFNNISFFINQSEGITYISESQIKDSLICYIIIKNYNNNNKTIIELNNYTNIFQLEYNGLIHESFQLYSIKLIQQLDYEQTQKYELYLINNNNIIYKLIVKVNDTNDNSPIFEQNIYYFNITENNKAHTCFGTIKANDLDSFESNNGVVRYKLLQNTLIGYKNTIPWNETIIQEEEDDDDDNNNNSTIIFYLNNNGHLCTQFELDREQYYKYTIEAIAFDLGDEPMSNQTMVLIHINVLDLNDNEPIFYHKLTKNEFYLKENSPQNTFIAWFKAYDLDDIGKNSEIEYKIMNNDNNESFNIDSKGVLTTNANLTSNTSLYSLDIRAKDKGEPNSLETKINITIKLITEEQYKKQLRIDVYPNRSLFYIRTDLLNANINNRSILKLNASTNDSNNNFVYQLIPLITNNCSHNDVLKLFNLTKKGELFLNNKSRIRNQICLLKIKVTDLSHPIQLSNQIEFTFIFTDLHSLLTINSTRNKLDSNNNNYYLIIIYFVLLLLFLIVLILLSAAVAAIIYNYYDDNNRKIKSENNRIVKINMKKLFKWFDTTNCNNSNNTNSINQAINSNEDDDDDDEFNLNNNETNKNLPKICNINNISSFSSFASKNSSKKSIVEEQLEKFEKIYYDNKKYLDSNLSNLLFNNNNNNLNNNEKKKELII